MLLTELADAAAASAPETWPAVAGLAISALLTWLGTEARRTRKTLTAQPVDAPRLAARLDEVVARQDSQAKTLEGVAELAGVTASAVAELRDEYRRERLADQHEENARLIAKLQTPLDGQSPPTV